MSCLSLRNHRLKFKTWGNLAIVLEEFIGHICLKSIRGKVIKRSQHVTCWTWKYSSDLDWLCPKASPGNDWELEGGHYWMCRGLWHKLKIQLQREPKIQPTQANQRILSGNQEILLICGLSFHVTTKLLWVKIRPLTHQVESMWHTNAYLGWWL